jgi:hypothetical protein
MTVPPMARLTLHNAAGLIASRSPTACTDFMRQLVAVELTQVGGGGDVITTHIARSLLFFM